MSAVVKSNAREARERAGRIRVGMVQYLHTLTDVAAAYAARDWMALGYESWESYVDGEYSEHRLKLSPEHRQKAVAELRLSGMSQRAIGTALGVSQETVRRDLSGDTSESPAEIVGADGKTYASTRPQPTETAVGADISPTDAAETEPRPVAASPESTEGEGSGEVIPHPEADASHQEWLRQFHERATAVREGRELFATFAADFDAESMRLCAGPHETGLMAALEASQGHDPAAFAATLDRLVPDPNPNREWQRRFLEAVSGLHKLMRFKPEDVAERADETCVDELVRIRAQFEDYFEAVIKARIDSTPNNVTPIRRIS